MIVANTTGFLWLLAVAVDLTIRIAALIVIPRDRKPTAAMAWLLAIFLIPFIGIFFFLLLGSPKLPAARRAKQARVNALIAEAVEQLPPGTLHQRAAWPPWFSSVVRMNEALTAIPIAGGNSATLLDDYDGTLASIAADIDRAERFVHVEYYIVSFDDRTKDVFRAMEDAVRRGVTVRVLLDHIASRRAAGSKRTFAELDRIGVSWAFMLPVQPLKGRYQRPDLRNHRKIVVVDGRVAYAGSQNLIARTYNSPKNLRRGLQWQELVTRVQGPAVAGLNAVFLSDWFTETDELPTRDVPAPATPLEPAVPEAAAPAAVGAGTPPRPLATWTAAVPARAQEGSLFCQVVPSGPGYEGENNLRLFLALMFSAQRRIIITSPYFVPDEAMVYGITSACERGVEVQLFVSELGDQGPVFHAQRSYYAQLLRAGVRIFRYPAPYILHAKHVSIDDDVAVIGSSNMDIRSFLLDLEVLLLIHGESFVADLRAVEAKYRAISSELTLEEWTAEPLRSTVLDGLARLTSALQ
jgi:cardiolipin synthase